MICRSPMKYDDRLRREEEGLQRLSRSDPPVAFFVMSTSFDRREPSRPKILLGIQCLEQPRLQIHPRQLN